MKLRKVCAMITLFSVIVVGSAVYPNLRVYAASNKCVVNEETMKGKVMGATALSLVYSDASIDAEILNVVLSKQIIRVLGKSGDFYKISYGDDFAYVPCENFIEGTALVDYIKEHPEWFIKNVEVKAEQTNLIDWLDDTVIAKASKGETFQLKAEEGDFYVAIKTAVAENGAETNTLVRIPKKDAKTSYQIHVTNFEDCNYNCKNTELVEYACEFVGYPYLWGGTDPNTGADCSGFIQYCFRQFGVDLPRCSWQQAEVGEAVEINDLRPGDLVFYYRGESIGHVAMYIGDNQVVQARGRNYGICITDLDYSTVAWARRVNIE